MLSLGHLFASTSFHTFRTSFEVESYPTTDMLHIVTRTVPKRLSSPFRSTFLRMSTDAYGSYPKPTSERAKDVVERIEAVRQKIRNAAEKSKSLGGPEKEVSRADLYI